MTTDDTSDAYDYGLAAQRAAEAHLEAIYDYDCAELDGEGPEGDHPAIGPWCGCETCVVREVLHVAWPHLRAAALALGPAEISASPPEG